MEKKMLTPISPISIIILNLQNKLGLISILERGLWLAKNTMSK